MAALIFRELGDYVEKVGKLFRLDAALLSIETKQNLRAGAVALAMFASAAFAAVLGVIFLLEAAFLALLRLGVPPDLAAVAVAVAQFVIAALLGVLAASRMRRWNLTPQRTLTQFRKNIEALRAGFQNEQRE